MKLDSDWLIIPFVAGLLFACFGIISIIFDETRKGLKYIAIGICIIIPILIIVSKETDNKKTEEKHKHEVIKPIQKITIEIIDQYIKCKKYKTIENIKTINQFSSDEEYINYKQKIDTIKKSHDEIYNIQRSIFHKIIELFGTIPEHEIWFRIELFDKEFGISKQITKTKKIDKYGRNIATFDHAQSTDVDAIYIKPWDEDLNYDNDDSYLFYKNYYLNEFCRINKAKLDEFIIEHFKENK